MPTLSGQTIQSTYQGLLKLADSTTGITSTYQQIQDGLGNNTNSRISTLGIQAPNFQTYNNLKPDYMGVGFTAAGVAASTNTQNRTLYSVFYDTGIYSYSAITYNCVTATTSSDVVNIAFYTMQQVPTIGIAPKDLIMSGITLVTNSTGIKTTTLPSTLSFSGTGGGYYIMAMIISNSNVTPTFRYTGMNIASYNQQFGLGFYINAAGTGTNLGSKATSIGPQFFNLLNNLSSFQTTYTQNDIITNFSTSIPGAYGYCLNVI